MPSELHNFLGTDHKNSKVTDLSVSNGLTGTEELKRENTHDQLKRVTSTTDKIAKDLSQKVFNYKKYNLTTSFVPKSCVLYHN